MKKETQGTWEVKEDQIEDEVKIKPSVLLFKMCRHLDSHTHSERNSSRYGALGRVNKRGNIIFLDLKKSAYVWMQDLYV